MQTRREYDRAIEAIRAHLSRRGYLPSQLYLPASCAAGGGPAAAVCGLARAQQAPYAAYLDGGDHAILSASPELFFRLENGLLEARPMKGTRERGRWFSEDRAMADGLTRFA